MVKGLILCGGKSSRLGQDKYLLNYHGIPQYEYLYRLFLSCDIRPFLSCNRAQADTIAYTFDTVMDMHESIGPIGGIEAAFHTDPTATWLVLACDLPFVQKDHIDQLIKNRSAHWDIVTYQHEFFETTCTIYEPECHKVIEKQVGAGEYSLHGVLKHCRVKGIPPLSPHQLTNVNTPEQLKQVRNL